MVWLSILEDDGGCAPTPATEAFKGAPWGENHTSNDATWGLFSVTALFPIVAEIATSLDLTSLDHLSQTCRQVRVNLLQYRVSLMNRSLRCSHEQTSEQNPRFPCARDLVGPCQRCSRVFCRNCIVKSKHTSLAGRHRRLCKTCIKAPLQDLMEPSNAYEQAAGPSTSLCACVEMMWICESCDRQLISEDISYMRGWSWRHRYSHTGVGIGEGEQGVACGRQRGCLAVREVEVEIDAEQSGVSYDMLEQISHGWSTTGYLTQEIEGIGGVVKKKVKKRVAVGHVVREHEEERISGEYLVKERTGKVRSWCAHCQRVIAGGKDSRPTMHAHSEVESDSSMS